MPASALRAGYSKNATAVTVSHNGGFFADATV
jgi:hypothetical protein